jgi:hypothetical protein
MVLVVAAVSLWVLVDARSRVAQQRPVTATLAGLTVERPEVWAVLCLVAVVLFLPLYLVARNVDAWWTVSVWGCDDCGFGCRSLEPVAVVFGPQIWNNRHRDSGCLGDPGAAAAGG